MRITVNGVERELGGNGDRTLLELLRDGLGLTGTKYGCGEGSCGACTVLLDGEPARACQLRAGEVGGRAVTTIEGLASDGDLHPVQRAFVELGAMQCGFCVPGMVLTAAALLARSPDPDEAEVRAALADNLCRCCGYPRILRAVRRAAELGGERDGWRPPEWAARSAQPELGAGSAGPWDLLPPERRDFFAVLPDGLVVVLPPRADSPMAAGGAWIHLGAGAAVTAFTGKVDVGQDSRTALALLVAEELGVPLASVRMVMGDTDVCPYDPGTFGSRSMPGAGEDLRATAAAGRRALSAAGGVAGLAGVRLVEVVSEPAVPTPPERWVM